ncbi:MAG: hypothetical protein ACTHM8_09130 [Sphingomonas sp.]
MRDHEMLTAIPGAMLAEAFTSEHREAAMAAGKIVARRLAPRQWTERFALLVEGETVLMPARLYFSEEHAMSAKDVECWPFIRALQSRSNDGYERQRAVRDLLGFPKPSFAPFIVALIGEYVVEILDDIFVGMTPEFERQIGSFLAANPAYWSTVKRRVTSYWNVYYRARWLNDQGRVERRNEYVGTRLVERLDAAVLRRAANDDEWR